MPVCTIAAVLIVLANVVLPSQVDAQSRTVFSGLPVVKVSEGGVERVPETLPRDKAVDLTCVISESGGKYYWVTRENKEMVRRTSGAFITYIATDGSGYVRLVDSSAKGAASLMSATEAKFDYVEHLLVGLIIEALRISGLRDEQSTPNKRMQPPARRERRG